MRSETQPESGSYLQGVLVDGNRPFVYRSGIRSLLGMPAWGGSSRIFSRTSPPTGFIYGTNRFWNEPFGGPFSDNGTAEAPPRPEANGLHEVSAETDSQALQSQRANPADSAQDFPFPLTRGKEDFEEHIRLRGAGPLSKQWPGPGDVAVSVRKAQKYEEPGKTIGTTGIETPVATAKHRHVQLAFSPDSPEENISSEKYGTKCHGQVPSPEPRRLISDGKAIEMEAQPENHTAKIPGAKVTRSFKAVEDGGTGARQVSASLNYAGDHIFNHTNQDAAARIEQLRQVVHELASKKSVQPDRRDNVTNEQQVVQRPPVPLQNVIIVKRPSQRTRVTQAFWERSYLGHFHLRPLR